MEELIKSIEEATTLLFHFPSWNNILVKGQMDQHWYGGDFSVQGATN